MYLIYGKGKVGQGLKKLLEYLGKNFAITDDEDGDNSYILAKNAKTIIPSPGINPNHIIYQNFGYKIKSEINFLYEIIKDLKIYNKIKFIGITGTNGKSTTTHILYNIFNKILPKESVRISGNFDIPLSETIYKILSQKKQKKTNYIITECSSFMLYGLKNMFFEYSILLNISRDHLDRHKDINEYKESKINIIISTTKTSITDTQTYNHITKELQQKTIKYNKNYNLESTHFIGKHNKGNLSACYKLTKLFIKENKLSTKNGEIKKIIETIKPLPHRLQLIKEINGIQIYDDGICTSTHSQAESIKSFNEKIILICGGKDKGNDYKKISNLYKKNVIMGVFIGTSAYTFKSIFDKLSIQNTIQDSLEKAIKYAYDYSTKNGKIKILFSPGCASFDMFQNVYDRIKQFENIINKL